MKIYIAVMFDRHIDDTYSVHQTLEGANSAVDKFLKTYEEDMIIDGDEWEEEEWGRPEWVRYVHSSNDDGPHALIEVSELLP